MCLYNSQASFAQEEGFLSECCDTQHCPLKNKNQTKKQYKDEGQSVHQRPHAGRAHLLKKLLFKKQRKSQAFSWAPCQHPIKSFSTAQVLRRPPTDFIKFFIRRSNGSNTAAQIKISLVG